ncbi:fructose PTS transporter subunit IIA [Tetragenococcus halophilus]|uniref:Fructose-specific phosphotransferase system enzyme IIA component n=1 Tax=Tetragenococcus halophilus (strain DSM 20338 / JCM 20259 / NCIMB 9735 / NBRC 12172) TaxID=945021 RepID=A0AAN1VQX2_TETHN|nr:fructose PTS transporter subunit IIA [Tetragenococcus halophilus]QXN86063.1 fructose PTS transporter subunit IIA [Tetragenococcus halophilus]RQD32552.1 PTS cellobiose transporter subunit IIA [Tetragenococcus halophilus subsp. halophilus DSM 20339]WJS81140.1 fructose PTS transporter subunit IIA [Tetragenococcus halophilus]BAK94475.1 putative fructose-specific phosphotransferase system enzyme IIA component [Tetragenococcus halophilus NBRC 12172]GBD59491.1 putative fructose-specific phosphotra
MDSKIFKEDHILFDESAKTQEEAFKVIAEVAFEKGYVSDETTFFKGLKERENEATTGFKEGIAIPHSKDASVIKPGMFLIKFKHAIHWQALDQKPVNTVFALTIPGEGASEHLKLLSLIARKLIDTDFREGILANNDTKKLASIIDTIDF